jgi:hypothetical protein
MGLMADLGGGPVGVDTAIFIYFIEERARFLPLVEPLSREVSEGRKELVTSALTLLRSPDLCRRENPVARLRIERINNGQETPYRSPYRGNFVLRVFRRSLAVAVVC